MSGADVTDAEWAAYVGDRCPICLQDPADPGHRCHCGLDENDRMCIEARVYGPCDADVCGGICVYESDCPCPCHRSSAEATP